jgi:iron complex outermembrane receptor protein
MKQAYGLQRRSLRVLLLTGGAAALTVAVSVRAADTTGASGDNAGDVAEITVTARHRVESAQTVPIGITALSGTQVAEQGAFNLKQIVQQLPSLNIQGYSGRNQTITIRGIGTNAGGTNDGLEQGLAFMSTGSIARAQVRSSPIWSMSRASRCCVVRRAHCSARIRWPAPLISPRPNPPSNVRSRAN